jgi:hypothetical protein
MNDRPRWVEREVMRPAVGLEGTPMREQKLPGKPRPRTEVLAEYQAQRARVRPEMWVLRGKQSGLVDHAAWGGIHGLAVRASRMASMGRRPWLRALTR